MTEFSHELNKIDYQIIGLRVQFPPSPQLALSVLINIIQKPVKPSVYGLFYFWGLSGFATLSLFFPAQFMTH